MKNGFWNNPNVGLLLIRLGLAAIFIVSGTMKLMNVPGVTAFFGKIGVAPIFVYIVAIVELVGGISMLLGFWTRVSGWLLAINMFFAIYLVRYSAGFAGTGYAYETMLLLAALGISFTGPGQYALGGKHESEVYN